MRIIRNMAPILGLALSLAAGSGAFGQSAPGWRSYAVTNDPSDIVSSPTVAEWLGKKVDATGGTSTGQTLTGASIDATSKVNGTAITSPAWLGFQTGYSSTITVCPAGCNYTTVSSGFGAALSMAHRLYGHGVVQLEIADGTYTETGQIYTTDPAGAFVNIIGDTANNANVVINFTGVKGTNAGGFVADNGGIIGLIDGVTLNAVGAQSAHTATSTSWYPASYGAGISAEHNAVIALGAHVTVNSFYYSVIADDGGMINARGGGVTGTDAGDVNFMARGNGTIVCTPCTATRAVDMTDPAVAVLGGCYDAERGGSLYIDGSTCTGANVAGVTALSNGKAWSHGVTVTGALRPQATLGVWTTEGGMIEAQNSTITGMNNGVVAGNGATIECNGCSITGSYGDGVVADGGLFLGTGTISQGSQTGYGYHALHQGTMHLFSVIANTTGNSLGSFETEGAGTGNGGSYTASTVSVGG
ncbi:hypothetical protein [Komagataeibacter sp. SM21]|uniref:hypothetical protein n=1 Tax=Komagataeibacter sp. SM21 TaxID=3242899 RepID=UPI003529CC70